MTAVHLLDSIIKNHGDSYRTVFQPYLVAAFAAVFEANEARCAVGPFSGVIHHE